MLKILQAEKHYNSQMVAENCFSLLDKKRTGEITKGTTNCVIITIKILLKYFWSYI